MGVAAPDSQCSVCSHAWPVRPAALSAELFNAVVDVAGTGHFLPYDKYRRWSGNKDERIMTEEIVHEPGLTVIPTLATHG